MIFRFFILFLISNFKMIKISFLIFFKIKINLKDRKQKLHSNCTCFLLICHYCLWVSLGVWLFLFFKILYTIYIYIYKHFNDAVQGMIVIIRWVVR
jgi:hypothetical protein